MLSQEEIKYFLGIAKPEANGVNETTQLFETTDIATANEYLRNGWSLKLAAPVTRDNINSVLYVLIRP